MRSDDISDKAEAWVTVPATLVLLVLSGSLYVSDRLHGGWIVVPMLALYGLVQLAVLLHRRLTR